MARALLPMALQDDKTTVLGSRLQLLGQNQVVGRLALEKAKLFDGLNLVRLFELGSVQASEDCCLRGERARHR